jgi:hypothetical protein
MFGAIVCPQLWIAWNHHNRWCHFNFSIFSSFFWIAVHHVRNLFRAYRYSESEYQDANAVIATASVDKITLLALKTG